jgi:hypothetical protein
MRAARTPDVKTSSLSNGFIGTTIRFMEGAVYDLTVVMTNVGIPPIVDGYECDYDERACVCAYDPSYTQSFATYEDYKNHMQSVHDSLAWQKRRTRKPCSSYVINVRRKNCRNQQQAGDFLNTPVKKGTLYEFVKLYDDFVQDIFRTASFPTDYHQRTWNHHLRIRPGTLEDFSLDSLLVNMNEQYQSRSRRRDLSIMSLGWHEEAD